MNEINQKIFKNQELKSLWQNLRSGEALASYYNASYAPSSEGEQDSPIKTDPRAVILKIADEGDQAKLDLENAICLYEAYGEISETQASDPRFWAYLTHVTFRSYVMARWPAGKSYEEAATNENEKQKAINKILSHWFVAGGSDRSLRRHALARLWWAVYLTVAPWERDSAYYTGFEETSDRYIFTKALFSTQDVYQQVLERGIGREPRLLIGVLSYVARHGSPTREEIRALMKELNLISSVKNLSLLPRNELEALIATVADDSQGQ